MEPLENATVEDVRNVRYTHDPELLDMEVQFSTRLIYLPYTARKGDTSGHGAGLFEHAMLGEFGPILPFVPLDEDTPGDPPTIISVSLAQAKLRLIDMGLYDDIEVYINNIEDPKERKKAQVEWVARNTVDRTNPLVAKLVETLAWTADQVNDFFLQASKL